MELDLKDRLILYNQYEILKKLEPDRKEKYELNQVILLNGYSDRYEDMLKGMIDEADTRVLESVENTLNLYSSLITSYKSLSKDEQYRINEEDLAFKGYDSKTEEEYYKYAYFLIYKLCKYQELKNVKGFEIESNSPKLRVYRDVTLKVEEVKDGSHDKFSADSIIQIINQYKTSL